MKLSTFLLLAAVSGAWGQTANTTATTTIIKSAIADEDAKLPDAALGRGWIAVCLTIDGNTMTVSPNYERSGSFTGRNYATKTGN
jgi:hypothetical protein